MKKLLFALIFLLFFSFVSAEEIQCIGSGNNFTGNFSLESDSFCEISLGHQGFKNSKLKINVSDVSYNGSDSFSFELDSYLILNESFLSSDNKGEYLLDCSSGFGIGDTLDLDSSDNFPFSQNCGDFGEDLVFLNIEKPKKDLDSPSQDFSPFTAVNIELKENLAAVYLKEKLGEFYFDMIGTNFVTGFKKTINELKGGISYSFSVVYPKQKGALGVISGSTVIINLDSIDYAKKTAVFTLTNAEENESELCKITSFFEKEEADFVDCKLADIRITGKNEGGKGKEVGSDVLFYFNAELKPKEIEVVDEKAQIKPEDKKDESVSNLTELQKQINNSILSEYNRLMGVNK